MTVKGSSSYYDWAVNDTSLLFGNIKKTDRYKEAHERLRQAKQKYGINATVIGHSLGGTIASYAGQADDNILTYNKGVTFGQKHRKNELHRRTEGDIISGLSTNDKHNINLKNSNNPNVFLHGLEALHGYNKGSIKDMWTAGASIYGDLNKSHNVDNLKNEKIYI
jgi:hypothetical protein